MTDKPEPELQSPATDSILPVHGRIEIPAGVDDTQAAAAAQALLRKRGTDIKTAWPALAHYLGKRFFNLLAIFTQSQKVPPTDAIVDGYLLTVWLSSRERLPADVIVAVRRYESQQSGKPRIWWQPDRRKVMVVWRWRGRAHNATLG